MVLKRMFGVFLVVCLTMGFVPRPSYAGVENMVMCAVYDDCITRELANTPTSTTAERIEKGIKTVIEAPVIFVEVIYRAFACVYTGPGSEYCQPF